MVALLGFGTVPEVLHPSVEVALPGSIVIVQDAPVANALTVLHALIELLSSDAFPGKDGKKELIVIPEIKLDVVLVIVAVRVAPLPTPERASIDGFTASPFTGVTELE